MKRLIKYLFISLIAFYTVSCDDFFITNPDDLINSDDYISITSEMYSGYFGLITKMQAVGDNAIFLTDTRGNFLEPTRNTPQDLIDIYNYADLTGNEYADPINYYSLIIAVNDYLYKMFEYKDRLQDAMETSTESHFIGLISSAIRVKVWAYLRLGQIYGEAVYFDDPLTDINNLTDFTTIGIDALLQKCLDLLDTGVNGIDGTHLMPWTEYLYPEDPTNSSYRLWRCITPDWLCLRCEILLWQNTGYEWIRENVLNKLSEVFMTTTNHTAMYKLNAQFTSNYYRMFAEGDGHEYIQLSTIPYDYQQGQTNRLITYFGNRTPAVFYLKPSSYAVSMYADNTGSSRANGCNYTAQDGDTVMIKYHINYRWRQPYESDAAIQIYRGHDYHFFLGRSGKYAGILGPIQNNP
ncbi:MAG: hypothetical protein LIO65_00300 [Odoribacter sp.]|nr:hypothetical protein [Odoribacter sp.]